MKKNITILILIMLFATQAFSQIAFYTMFRGETKLNTIPRLSIDVGLPVNIAGPWAVIKSNASFFESGLFITRNGLTYDDDKTRYVHNVTGISFPLRGGVIVKDIYYIGTGYNLNFNLYYKQKTFTAGGRQNKFVVASGFFDPRVSIFYPSLELSAGVSLHGLGRFSIRAQYFPTSLLNKTFTELVSGMEVRPYEDLVIMPNIKILLSYNPAL